MAQQSADVKIKTTVGFTPRSVKALNAEAKRMGISFAETLRRWIEPEVDRVLNGAKDRTKLYDQR